jgi:hypothetical protein
VTTTPYPTAEELAAEREYFEREGPLLAVLKARLEEDLTDERRRFALGERAREHPCVGSGYCCKVTPCPYGRRDAETGWCAHLVPWPGDTLETPRYRCGRYDYIRTKPDWVLIPAFGGGCVAPGNGDRASVLVELRRKERDAERR